MGNTTLQDRDGLAIMDAVADVLADRSNVDLVTVKEAIQKAGTQRLYEQFIAPAIDQLEAALAIKEQCDCSICHGEGFVGRDGATCSCIIAGCRKRHGRDAYLPPRHNTPNEKK